MFKKVVFLLTFIIGLNSIAFANSKEVYEVDNSKEISLPVLQRLFETSSYAIYLDNSKLNGEKLKKEDKDTLYHYIGYTADNEHFFETIKKKEPETQKPKETEKPKEIKVQETKKQDTTTISMEQIASAETKDKPVLFTRSQWLDYNKNKILSPRELIASLKTLGQDSVISISCIVQRQTIEYDKSQLTEDILIDIARKEGKTNFKIMPNSDNEYIYLTVTQFSTP